MTELVGRATDAQALEERYALALDASDQSIWDWDPEADRMTIGERFWDQVGRPDLGPSVSLAQFLDLVAAADREQISRVLSESINHSGPSPPPAARDLRFETLHGEERHFTLTYVPTPASDGSPAQMTGLIRDVTESHRLRQAIIEARERAEAATQARAKFLAVMSHEIRTPLNGVLGTARLLLDADLEPAQRELARVIKEAGEALLRIINQVLDYSRLEAAGVDFERTRFDLAQVIESAAKLMTPDAEAKGLRIDTRVASDVARDLVGDPGRIRQIVLNLLSNAIKFTQQGYISVSAFAVEKSADTVWSRIEVQDTGIGIAEEARGRVFDEFIQADASVSRVHGGSGLGLAICRRLAHQMGGEMGLSSQPGGGSTFWLRLPLGVMSGDAAAADVAGASVAAAPAGSATPAGPILVVDDNAINRQVMAALLDGLGEDYDLAEGGKDAIAAVQRRSYDAVLMDLQMPGVDGEQAARAVRNLPGHAVNPPIIAVTAMDEAAAAYPAIDGFVGKPIDAAEVARALGEARAGRTAASTGEAHSGPALNTVFATLESTLGRGSTVTLYREFARDVRRRIDRMKAASGRGDIEALRRDAHDLKSTAGNFGFAELSDLGGAIETACRNHDAGRARELAGAVDEPAARTLSAIEALGGAAVPEDSQA